MSGTGTGGDCLLLVLPDFCLAVWDKPGETQPRQWTSENCASRNSPTTRSTVRSPCVIGRFLLLPSRSPLGGALAGMPRASDPSCDCLADEPDKASARIPAMM